MSIFNRKLKHKINLLQDKVDFLEKQLAGKKMEISEKNKEISELRLKAFPPLYGVGDKIGDYVVIDAVYIGKERVLLKAFAKSLPFILVGFPYIIKNKASETFALCAEASKLYEKEGWIYTLLNNDVKIQRTEAQVTELKNEADGKENN